MYWRNRLPITRQDDTIEELAENPNKQVAKTLIEEGIALETLLHHHSFIIDKMLVQHGYFLEEIAYRKTDLNTWKLIANTGKHLPILASHDDNLLNCHIIKLCKKHEWDIPPIIYQSKWEKTQEKLKESSEAYPTKRRPYRTHKNRHLFPASPKNQE